MWSKSECCEISRVILKECFIGVGSPIIFAHIPVAWGLHFLCAGWVWYTNISQNSVFPLHVFTSTRISLMLCERLKCVNNIYE